MIKHCQKRKKPLDLSVVCLSVASMVFVASLGFRIHSAGKLAVKNESLKIYSEKKIALEKEMALIEYEESKYSSLKYLETAAMTLGFIKAVEPLYAVDFINSNSIASAR